MAIPTQSIPIVDFQDYNINVNRSTVSDTTLNTLAGNVVGELEKVGFCYLTNHGIPENITERHFAVCRRFFDLPLDRKRPYERTSVESFHGWVRPEEESLNVNTPGDLKESFNFLPGFAPSVWPSVMPEFQETNQIMFDNCQQLAHRLLEVLSLGLGFDRDYFHEKHARIGHPTNSTALRSLYYPPLGANPAIEPGQNRLGEHSDYGTFTILFQDDVGGLEVNIPEKGFVPATPIPGTVLVNIGDAMQRWTSDRLIATRHRVPIPETEVGRNKARQSFAYFVNPDDDVIVRCLDGSAKYEPIKYLDYLDYRFRLSFTN